LHALVFFMSHVRFACTCIFLCPMCVHL
jgi:hypothetical protein